jgi:ribosome maturation factor RimP
MELTERIAQLLTEKYTTDELFADCFTVEIELKPGNKLNVFADSDSGMTFEKCQKLSRFLEGPIDENGWLGDKYVLEVSSPGITRPLKFTRQYIKNVGRNFEVTLLDKTKVEGILKSADEEKIVITFEVVEKEGKKKIKTQVEKEIPYANIEKALVKILGY